MKKFLLVIIAITGVAKTLAQSKDELAVRNILAEQTISWNKGNLKDFMKGYWQSDSLQFIGKSGLTYGWMEALNNYIKNYPDRTAMGKLSFNSIDLKKLSSRYFFVTGKWRLIRSAGNLSGYFTLLLKKINNHWRIISDHSS